MITDLQEPATGLIADIEDCEFKQPVEKDGYLWDPNTGECLGMVGVEPQFEVKDLDSAQWVLQKMLETELDIKRCDDEMRVISENIDKKRKPHQRKLDFLKMRFGPQLEEYAKVEVATRRALGVKEKFIQTSYGRLATRTVKAAWKLKNGISSTATGSLDVIEIPPFVAWAIDHAPSCVKRTLEVMALPKGERPKEFFELHPEYEAVKIETGI